jgi:hypothetical protein
MLRIERQKMLEPEDDVGEDNPNQTKGKKGKGILLPVLLSLRFYSKKSVKKFFKGPHDRSKERSFLCFKNLKEVAPHGFGQNEEHPDKYD